MWKLVYMSESSCSQKRSIQCNRLHHYTMNTLNFDHLSPSSCKVIFSWGKYYAKFSIVKPVALFLSFPKIAMAICVCLFLNKISCPKRFAHGAESCTKVSTYYVMNPPGPLMPVTYSIFPICKDEYTPLMLKMDVVP